MNYKWVLKIKNQLINKCAVLNDCVNFPLAPRYLAPKASGEARRMTSEPTTTPSTRASSRHSRECVNLPFNKEFLSKKTNE